MPVTAGKTMKKTQTVEKTKKSSAEKKSVQGKAKANGKNKAPETSTRDEDIWHCETCEEEFAEDDCKVFECEVCGLHFCWKCLDLSEEEYIFLTNRSDLHWYCKNCEGNALLSIRTDKEIAQRCTDYFKSVEIKLNSLEKDINQKADKKQIEQLEEMLNNKADSAALKMLEERITNIESRTEKDSLHITGPSNTETKTNVSEETSTVNIKNRVDDNVKELIDREWRKNNIVVFNIKESESEETDERKLHDTEEASKLLNSELKINTAVTKPVRLGLKRDNSKFPRPLRLTVDNEETKWKILKAAKNLLDSREESYKTVFIKKDMTPMEREKERELRAQLAEKKRLSAEKGETCSWFIRKGKIVKQHQRSVETD